ncbi:hypothetical protein SeMB42_g07876 [Synchytrium endobioticum]|uniref:RRM domain-containing protein n=1 Tax=Synchytrium endobioticum TaxID=286115 RepID=A0A507BST6_9FUNG|nr:hypothetical protein SeMB42_g07876 [Synchytrium endobioticum]TPX42571.1 hypothetical protein SeLEV6574_g05523 [Synchytrium endobioticum]
MSQSRRKSGGGLTLTSARPAPYRKHGGHAHRNVGGSIASRLSTRSKPVITFTTHNHLASSQPSFAISPGAPAGLFANHVVTEVVPHHIRIIPPQSTPATASSVLSRLSNNQHHYKHLPISTIKTSHNESAILSRLSGPAASVSSRRDVATRPKSTITPSRAEILDLTQSEEPMDVDVASPPPHATAASPSTSVVSIKGQSDGPTSITIKNLHLEATDADVQACFMEFGLISNVKLLKNAKGDSTGVAQVTFKKRSAALAAIAKYHGQLADGNLLEVFETVASVVGASRRTESAGTTPTTTNATKPPSASSFSYSAAALLPRQEQRLQQNIPLATAPKRTTPPLKTVSRVPACRMYADREEMAAKARVTGSVSAGKTMFSNAMAQIIPSSTVSLAPSSALGITAIGTTAAVPVTAVVAHPVMAIGNPARVIHQHLATNQPVVVSALKNGAFTSRIR